MNLNEIKEKFQEYHEHWNNSYKISKQVSKWLLEIIEAERNYAFSLERVSAKMQYDYVGDNLTTRLNIMKDVLNARVSTMKSLSDSLETNLAIPLQVFLAKQAEIIQENSITAKRLMTDMSNYTLRLEKYKERYIKSCKSSNDTRINKECSAYRLEQESLKSYYSVVDEYNSLIPSLNDKLNNLLTVYISQEEERLNLLKQTLLQTLQFQKFYSKTLDVDLTEAIPKIESYKPLSDIEFYRNRHRKAASMAVVGRYQSKELIHAGPASHEYLMTSFIEILWNGDFPDEDVTIRFLNQIRNSEGRKAWTNGLNSQRSKGNFDIPNSSFEFVGDCMTNIIDAMMVDEDYTIAGLCIILADSFYEADTEPKRFLHSLIISHPLWKNIDFWRELVEDSVAFNWKEYCKNGGSKDQEIYKNIATAQIMSYAHTMNLFKISKDDILLTVGIFEHQYKLNEDIQLLIQTNTA